MLKYLTAVCLTAAWLFSANGFAAEPVNHVGVLAPFVNQDSFAIVYAGIASLDLPKDREAILTPQSFFIMQSLPAEVQAQIFIAGLAETFAVRFREAGGQGIYVLAGLADVRIGGGPIVIATAQPGRRPEEVQQFFGMMIQETAENPSYRAMHPYIKQLDVQKKGDAVLVGMKGTVARYASMKSAARDDLTSPLERMGREGAVASAVFCPGPDFRRVVRELWPELPGALAPLKGDLADHWLHLEAAINGPPKMNPRLALHTNDPESAKTFVRLWKDLPIAVTQFGGNEKSVKQASGYAQLLVSALPAKAEGTRVAINIPSDQDILTKLSAMLGKAVGSATESSNRRERMDRFKQIAIAMLNYHDVHKFLPPAAIRDKNGKPLLSWRVAILPYLEQNDLYKQFHLDEPWDSPHNRLLVAKMPGVYADPDPKMKQLTHDGKTTYQVPVGPETIFYNKEGASMRDVKDGTSHTVLVVDVDPQQAVEWTKPEDWQVDMKNPRQGVVRKDRDFFTAGFADGHVTAVPAKEDPQTLRAILTRAGGETVRQPPY